MARTFPTPCTQPGCPALVKGGGRCPKHVVARTSNALTSTGGRIYDLARWTAVRIRVIREEPWCRACLTQGIKKLSSQVDHIIALEDGGDPWSRKNLQALCNECHGAKTLQETRARR